MHTETTVAMAMYILYLWFMSMNGVSEAYYYAITPSSSTSRYTYVMLVFGAIQCVLSILMINAWGVVGIIMGNSIGM